MRQQILFDMWLSFPFLGKTEQTRRLQFAAGLLAVLGAVSTGVVSAQQSLTVFDHSAVSAYDNVPTVAADGTLVLRNTNPRSTGSDSYVSGVGTTAMPAYSAGDTLQWAILARTTTGASAPLNIGVQNGIGDVNNLSIGQVSLPTLRFSDQFEWIVTSPVRVDAFKSRAYFWIPGTLGQEIQIKRIVLGDPGSIQAFLTSSGVQPVVFEPVLNRGWNLVGYGQTGSLDIMTVFGNQTAPVNGVTNRIISVWKWDAVNRVWAFFSPQLTSAESASFAATNGYSVLSSITPGEGYWVDAAESLSLPAQYGTARNWTPSSFAVLPSGWNLIAQGEAITPSAFNQLVSAGASQLNGVPTDGLLTLWAWHALGSQWLFYSSVVESQSGLAGVKAFADSHAYLDFQDQTKMLGLGIGFWVLRPLN